MCWVTWWCSSEGSEITRCRTTLHEQSCTSTLSAAYYCLHFASICSTAVRPSHGSLHRRLAREYYATYEACIRYSGLQSSLARRNMTICAPKKKWLSFNNLSRQHYYFLNLHNRTKWDSTCTVHEHKSLKRKMKLSWMLGKKFQAFARLMRQSSFTPRFVRRGNSVRQ